ncbi:uncharacterized protein LOC122713019 [Apis laboriosa]|uniref:uncharacterized protein LOC122713019 n=1 Tax=Apis laboriosa TaxID=183418 RepID=UPI001CC3C7C8|nr:uncharacterized protein LOC122713019 [Apis laboriosa]
MWLFFLILAIASSRSVIAFPQNDLTNLNNIEIQTLPTTFEVDGFIFDGPANRPLRQTSTTVTTTSTAATVDPQFDQCVATCRTTPEYNPVCGTDQVEYKNPGQLSCASMCGKDVSLRHYGRCTTTKIRGR